jgi:hypothetical protein
MKLCGDIKMHGTTVKIKASNDYVKNQKTSTHFTNVNPYSTHIFKSRSIMSIKLAPDNRTCSCKQQFVVINASTFALYSCSDDRLMFSERRGSSCISAACMPSCLQTNWIKEYLTTIRYFISSYLQTVARHRV